MPQSAHPAIGIDLGTTYSVVAYVDANGRPTTVPNGIGDLLTPSAVAFEDGNVIVGKEAVKGAALDPGSFADCFKRDMGRPTFRRAVVDNQVPPQILSAFLLERLKQEAERRVGTIRQVVITVPAFFDELRRLATQEAGKLAGLDVLDIINEPTAAAVAYGYHRNLQGGEGSPAQTERIVVYDLGGGTFDVTVLEITSGCFRTLATDGDVQLGGKDFDERLVNHLAEKFLEAHGVDPRSDPKDAVQLWFDAQEAKHALTERTKTTVVIFHAGLRLRVDVTRQDFEQLTRELLERTRSTVMQVLRQAGLDWRQIARVLLVGGASRMPMVIEMLTEVAGQPPDRSQSADEVVAHGAALYADHLTRGPGQGSRGSFELVNVNSHSLGVVGIDPTNGRATNVPLIPKNTPLPFRSVKNFQTARANQSSVKVSIVEGDNSLPEYCIALGECILRDLPPNLPQGSTVEVEYRYAANGRLSVSARLPSTRQSAQVEIQRANPHSADDLETWRRRLCGKSPNVAAPPTQDPATAIAMLDELYVRAGGLLAGEVLPPQFQRSQQAVRAAVDEKLRAQEVVDRATTKRGTAVGALETASYQAGLAQAQQTLHIAEARLRGTSLVLGRECAAISLWPAAMGREKSELFRLQELLQNR